MHRVHEQVRHIYSCHVENRKAGQQAANHSRDNHKSAVPQYTLKYSFQKFHHFPRFSVRQSRRIKAQLSASGKLKQLVARRVPAM